MRVLIIIPAYNEAESIGKVVNNICELYPEMDYLIVNDGSTDETERICREMKFKYITLPINLGIGGAVQAGYRYALQEEYDIAVQMDGDGQHDPKFLGELLHPILDGKVNGAIGSRFLEKEGFQSSRTRRFGIKFLSGLIFLCTGVKIKDVTSGYRAVDKNLIKIYAQNYSLDYPEPEAIVTAVVHGMKIKEVPVVMQERQSGVSSINLKKSFYYMIKVSLAVIITRISFGIRRNKEGERR